MTQFNFLPQVSSVKSLLSAVVEALPALPEAERSRLTEALRVFETTGVAVCWDLNDMDANGDHDLSHDEQVEVWTNFLSSTSKDGRSESDWMAIDTIVRQVVDSRPSPAMVPGVIQASIGNVVRYVKPEVAAGEEAKGIVVKNMPRMVFDLLYAVSSKHPEITQVGWSVSGHHYFSDEFFSSPDLWQSNGLLADSDMLTNAGNEAFVTKGFPCLFTTDCEAYMHYVAERMAKVIGLDMNTLEPVIAEDFLQFSAGTSVEEVWESFSNFCTDIRYELVEPFLQHPLSYFYLLWDQFADVAVNESDEIETQFLHFSAGAPKEEIWAWFEKQHPDFVVGEVLNGKRRTDTI